MLNIIIVKVKFPRCEFSFVYRKETNMFLTTFSSQPSSYRMLTTTMNGIRQNATFSYLF